MIQTRNKYFEWQINFSRGYCTFLLATSKYVYIYIYVTRFSDILRGLFSSPIVILACGTARVKLLFICTRLKTLLCGAVFPKQRRINHRQAIKKIGSVKQARALFVYLKLKNMLFLVIMRIKQPLTRGITSCCLFKWHN